MAGAPSFSDSYLARRPTPLPLFDSDLAAGWRPHSPIPPPSSASPLSPPIRKFCIAPGLPSICSVVAPRPFSAIFWVPRHPARRVRDPRLVDRGQGREKSSPAIVDGEIMLLRGAEHSADPHACITSSGGMAALEAPMHGGATDVPASLVSP